jgi:hypothetical protein
LAIEAFYDIRRANTRLCRSDGSVVEWGEALKVSNMQIALDRHIDPDVAAA